MANSLDRRTFVAATGTLALSALAGCSGGASGDDGGTSGDGAPTFDGWLAGVDNYDGVTDETGTDAVTVTVGAEGNGGNFAFDPPAIRISSGTDVTWEWTGKGSTHNAVANDGRFESDLTTEAGYTFSHTFEETGTCKYYCEPHKTIGMKGVVVVE